MLRIGTKPTHFGSGHVFNSKLVLEPCKTSCLCFKLDPMDDNKKIHRTQF